jgi:toxin CptA
LSHTLRDALRVRLRPSRTLTAALAAGHAVALAAAAAGLPLPAAVVVAAGLGLSAIHHLRLAAHRAPLAVVQLELAADGRLALADPSGNWLPAELRRAAVPSAWLALVVARDAAGRWRSAVVLPDAADADAFRRLRVWLKWRTSPSDPTEGGANDPVHG